MYIPCVILVVHIINTLYCQDHLAARDAPLFSKGSCQSSVGVQFRSPFVGYFVLKWQTKLHAFVLHKLVNEQLGILFQSNLASHSVF